VATWVVPFQMATPADPPTWPALPVLAVLGLAIALTPALVAPPLPEVFAVALQAEPHGNEVAA
jgi:hypothetical protein